jgi:hypothetical protein
MVGKAIHELLEAGWSAVQIKHALVTSRALTVTGLEVELRKGGEPGRPGAPSQPQFGSGVASFTGGRHG